MFEKYLKRLDPKDMQLKCKYINYREQFYMLTFNLCPKKLMYIYSYSRAGCPVISNGIENAEKES